MSETKDRSIAYKALKTGRKAFRGYAPERAAGKRARRTMVRVFEAKGLYLFASVLRNLIKNPKADWEIKRQKFEALLQKYAKAVSA